MTNSITVAINKKLHDIIQLNPFDAVAILKFHDGHCSVEMVNTSATVLFNTQFTAGMDAVVFFKDAHWNQLQPCLNKQGEMHYVTLQNAKQIVVNMQPVTTSEGSYISVVMRLITNDVTAALEAQIETAKHLYFVEQYVDPVISLDLNGHIIYANIAAANKLAILGNQILGKSIFELIDEEYVGQFGPLFRNTLEGYPMGMPQCVLKNKMFSEEPVCLKTFPTYWDGKVIGAHIVIKNVDEFFNDREHHHFIVYQDELTGLFNRRALNEQWTMYSERQHEMNIALILVDLDRFKKFNESLGKNKADGMLYEVSKRFGQLRNEFCEVFRYNGDEFVFLVRYYAREEVEVIANEILRVLLEPFVVEEQEYFITASIGIASSVVGQPLELDKLLHRADQALFYVKNHGRSHYRFYRKEMSQAFPNEALIEAHLRRAIEFDELAVHFQPQIDLVTNRIDSFEALLRWNNKKFGAVPPSQFIPIAESSGLIIHIGDWILERVFQYQKEWRELGYRPVRIAINISPKQFKQEQFVSKIKHLLETYEIEPEFVELEITEGSMTNVHETSSILRHLKQLGVYVSVDDFGTGYSSLSYLKTYPIDIIKIDQSFIADIEKDKKNEAIIKAIILLSHNLGLEVVAEGVEEKNQEQFLKNNNCEKVQGYLYNKPLPVEKVIEQYFIN
ncbi:sensor domain-containing protein [Solibacillus sp. FSL H8-0538]|uniref:sensor domain-containing protein n=1 Tax=Solibacillus sp. FSL H8-0538 TaxID=2921400 RepID=UPI0030FABBEE